MTEERIDVGRYFLMTIWRGVPLAIILKQWDFAQTKLQDLPPNEYRAIQHFGLYFFIVRRKGARLSEIAREFLELLNV